MEEEKQERKDDETAAQKKRGRSGSNSGSESEGGVESIVGGVEGDKEKAAKEATSGAQEQEGEEQQGRAKGSTASGSRAAAGASASAAPALVAPTPPRERTRAEVASRVEVEASTKKAAAAVGGKETGDVVEVLSLSAVRGIIERATDEVKKAGLVYAEHKVQRLDRAGVEKNPMANELLAFMHMLASSQSFVREGRSYVGYMNALATKTGGDERQEEKQRVNEQIVLRRSVNVALGRPPNDLRSTPGDLYIKLAYESGFGWSLADGQECRSKSTESFCGFDMDFILATTPKTKYSTSNVPDSGGGPDASDLRKKRLDWLAGTTIVVSLACLRDVLRDNTELFDGFTSKPVSKTVALLLAGIWVSNTMRSSKKKGGESKEGAEDEGEIELKHFKKHLEKPHVECLPSFEVMKKRVKMMMDARELRGGLTNPVFNSKEALAWVPDENKSGSPKKKRRTDEAEGGLEGSGTPGKAAAKEAAIAAEPDLKTTPSGLTCVFADLSKEKFAEGGVDDGAEQYFKRLFKKCFLDGEEIPDDLPQKLKPWVERVVTKHEMCKGRFAELLQLHNVFSDNFVRAIFYIYRLCGLPFINEDSKAFRPFMLDPISVLDSKTSVTLRASFQIGKEVAARHMRAFECHVVERMLTVLVESHVRAAMKHKLGEQFELVLNCGGVNICMLHYRKGFLYHFDHDPFNTLLESLDASLKKAGGVRVGEKAARAAGSSSSSSAGSEGVPKSEHLKSHHDEHLAPLPTPGMMVIATAIFAGPLGSVLSDSKNYKLTWRMTDSHEHVAELVTGHNKIHLQIGMDGICQHGGKAIRYSFRQNCYRISITLRGYANPSVNMEAWKSRAEMCNLSSSTRLIGEDDKELVRDVLKVYENPQYTEESSEIVEDASADEDEETTGKASRKKRAGSKEERAEKVPDCYRLCKSENHDVYPNCPLDEIPAASKNGLSSVPPILQQRQPIAKLYLSWVMQKILLKYRIVVCVLIYDHDIKEMKEKGIPLVARSVPMWETGTGALALPKRMTYYSSAAMQLIVNVIHSNIAHPIVCNDHPLACTSVVLSKPDRIDHESFRKYVKGEADWFFFYGSGGGGTAAGQKGPDISKAHTSELEAWGYPPSPQDTDSNATNRVLLQCAENTQMMSVWVSCDVAVEVLGDVVAPPKGRGYYLHVGRFYMFGEETVEGQTSAETAMQKDKYSLTDYASYRLRSYHIFKVREVDESWFEGLEYNEDATSTEGKRDWRQLTITDRCDEYADLRLPPGDQNLIKHIGVGADKLGGVVATQLEYHYEQGLKELRPELLNVHTMEPIGENNPEDRADSKPWIEDRNRLREKNPYAKPLDPEQKPRQKKVSIKEWRNAVVAIAIAGFMRVLMKSVNEKKESIPLEDERLGSLLRQFSLPMPWRDYDVAVLLYGYLSSDGFTLGDSENLEELQENLLAAVICHLYGRAGFIGNYINTFEEKENESNECLRPRYMDKFISHLKLVVSDPNVSLSKCVVQQYENQIPAVLRNNVKAAENFLRLLVSKLEDIAKTVLKEGKKSRREYVMDLAEVFSAITPGIAPPKFYFLAQHIVATLALSYEEGRFGTISLRDVYMGPGSAKAVKALGLKRRRPKREKHEVVDPFDSLYKHLFEDEAKLVLKRIVELPDNALHAMGLYRDGFGRVRVRLTDRLLTYLDIEHMLCKLYLLMQKKSPAGLQSIMPCYHTCQCHPARFNTDRINLLLVPSRLSEEITMKTVAEEAVAAFAKMGKSKLLSWRMLFRDEWEDPNPDFDLPPLVDEVLQENEEEDDEDYEDVADNTALGGGDEDGYGWFFGGPNDYYTDRRNENSVAV